MPTNYTGNPTAAQSPDVAPRAGQFPLLSLPADGDPDAAATYAQAYKRSADGAAYNMSNRPGIWRELLWPTGSYVANQAPVPNHGQLQIGISGGSSSVSFNDPGAISSGYNKRCATLTAGATSTNYAALFSAAKQAGFVNSANLVACAEWDWCFDASALINSTQNVAGFTDSSSFVTSISNGIYVIYQNPTTSSHFVFHVQTSAGGGSSNVTLAAGFDPAAGTFQHFKIQFYGASTPQGVAAGNAYTTLTINDVLAATINFAASNKIPAANCFFGAGVEATSSNAGASYMGNWTLQWDGY